MSVSQKWYQILAFAAYRAARVSSSTSGDSQVHKETCTPKTKAGKMLVFDRTTHAVVPAALFSSRRIGITQKNSTKT